MIMSFLQNNVFYNNMSIMFTLKFKVFDHIILLSLYEWQNPNSNDYSCMPI